MTRDDVQADWPVRRQALTGGIWLAILLLGFGAWLAFANLSAATIAKGRLSESSNSHEVQHLTGGLVTEINVAEGDVVRQGAVLLRLDDREMRTNLAVLRTRIFEISTRRGRLTAQRDGLPSIPFEPHLLLQAQQDTTFQAALDGQIRLFQTQSHSWQQEQQMLEQKAVQVSLLAQGISTQITAYQRQLTLVKEQMADVQSLRAQGLVPATRLTSLQQEIADIEGTIGAARSKHAKTQVEIAEINLEILRAQTARQEAAIEELRDLEFRQNELVQEQKILENDLENLSVRAPINGTVLGLGPIAPQTVIEPAQVLMRIVPQTRQFVIKARVPPNRIGTIFPGQPVRLVFTDPTQRTPQSFNGTVHTVSADTLTEPETRQPYFLVQITPGPEMRREIETATHITMGMVADVYFTIGEQSAWAYLAGPILNYFSKAMRES